MVAELRFLAYRGENHARRASSRHAGCYRWSPTRTEAHKSCVLAHLRALQSRIARVLYRGLRRGRPTNVRKLSYKQPNPQKDHRHHGMQKINWHGEDLARSRGGLASVPKHRHWLISHLSAFAHRLPQAASNRYPLAPNRQPFARRMRPRYWPTRISLINWIFRPG